MARWLMRIMYLSPMCLKGHKRCSGEKRKEKYEKEKRRKKKRKKQKIKKEKRKDKQKRAKTRAGDRCRIRQMIGNRVSWRRSN